MKIFAWIVLTVMTVCPGASAETATTVSGYLNISYLSLQYHHTHPCGSTA